MSIRSLIMVLLLGLPAAGLLVFGPSGRPGEPPNRTIVQYWEKWTGVEGQAMQRIVDRFNQTEGARQGIWVDYNALGDVDKRMLISAAGGDPPDVAGLPDRFVAPYADQGALQPLDDLAREFDLDLAAFKPIWLNICRYDGTLYALPSTPYTIALYYNRTLFRAAGLDPDRPPQTTAELSEFAQRLTRYEGDDPRNGRIIQLGFTVSPAMLGWWTWIWPYFFDGELWDGHRFTLDTPETHAALGWVRELRTALGNKRVLQFEGTSAAIESAQNPFLCGQLAMVFQGPWLSNWARIYVPDLDYGVAPFPSVTRERRHVFASTDVFVIPTGARHRREAMIFLQYVLQQPVMEELCSAHGKVSPYRVPGPDFFARHPNPHIRMFDEMATSPYAFGYPAMPTWAEAWTEMLYLLETVMREARDPDEAIRMTQTKVDNVVADYERMEERRRGRCALKLGRDSLLTGLLWTAPWWLGFLLLLAGPMILSLYISFCDYPLLQPPVFTGLANYQQLAHDAVFHKTIWNTVIYASTSIPIGTVLAVLLAILLNQRVRGQAFFRACIFVPTVVPLVAAGVVWMWLLNPEYGLLNTALRGVGVEQPPLWLESPRWAMSSLVLVSLWFIGSPVIIYLAGLQEIPEELYEAARLDGASAGRRLWHVTLPGLSPVILFNVIMGIITSWQVFALPYLMWRTRPGPDRVTYFYTMYLFDNAFSYLKMGYASAMAWIQLLIILALTGLVFLLSRRSVYYRGV